MRVALRVDASSEIGSGHVMRCLTLADALAKEGAACSFLCRPHAGHLIDLIASRGHAVISLPPRSWPENRSEPPGSPRHAKWAGAPQDQDAADTLAAIAGQAVDWMVVDHYGLDASWERHLRSAVDHVLVIDDLADRPHACDVLLDQNWHGVNTASRYESLVPEDCLCLLGPLNALLGPEYARLRDSTQQRDGVIRRVLVFVGGSDPDNLTGRIVEALATSDLAQLAVDVVLGNNHPAPGCVEQQVRQRPRTRLHRALPTLAPLMADADLMVGAGGATTWERMCLGLPAVVISIAANQEGFSQTLMEHGYINYLGRQESVSTALVAKCLSRLIRHPDLLREQSRRGQSLVTGTGASELALRMSSMVSAEHAAA